MARVLMALASMGLVLWLEGLGVTAEHDSGVGQLNGGRGVASMELTMVDRMGESVGIGRGRGKKPTVTTSGSFVVSGGGSAAGGSSRELGDGLETHSESQQTDHSQLILSVQRLVDKLESVSSSIGTKHDLGEPNPRARMYEVKELGESSPSDSILSKRDEGRTLPPQATPHLGDNLSLWLGAGTTAAAANRVMHSSSPLEELGEGNSQSTILKPGMVVALTGGARQLYCSVAGLTDVCDSKQVGKYEMLQIVDAGAGRIGLIHAHNKATSRSVPSSNAIVVGDLGRDTVSLKLTSTGRFASDGTSQITWDATEVGPAEKFKVTCYEKCPVGLPQQTVGSGGLAAIKASLTAEQKKSAALSKAIEDNAKGQSSALDAVKAEVAAEKAKSLELKTRLESALKAEQTKNANLNTMIEKKDNSGGLAAIRAELTETKSALEKLKMTSNSEPDELQEGSWSDCAKMNGRCLSSGSGIREVRFGKDPDWIEMDTPVAPPGVRCTPDTFGVPKDKQIHYVNHGMISDMKCQIKSCVNHLTVHDAGAKARCSTTKCDTAKGALNCVVDQKVCRLKSEDGKGGKYCASKWKCKCTDKNKFGPNYSISSCPDGKITHLGVFKTFPTSRFSKGQTVGMCSAWSSEAAAIDMLECKGSVCSKQSVKHFHHMSQSAAAFMYKRLRCTSRKCWVYKSGRCIDVGQGIYNSKYNGYITHRTKRNMRFAEKAEKMMANGESVECSRDDQALFEKGVKAY